jgi:DNA repair protein RecN (Recombination protein N)
MLEFLRIQNLALIQDLEMEFSPGLNVLTGESGAGKSFVLRALDFILGEKLQPDMVRAGKDKARVEAIFALPEGDYILRREIAAQTGRSRLFLNDSLTSQDKIRTLKNRLILHTSQHSQQKLLSPGFHQQILDGFVDESLLTDKDALLQQIREIQAQKQSLLQKSQDLEAQREFLEHQASVIDKTAPQAGEEEELERKKFELRHQAQTHRNVQAALDILHNPESPLLENIHSLQRTLEQLAGIVHDFQGYAEQLDDIQQFFSDLDASLRQQPSPGESEQELESIEYRLFELSRLQRQLNRSLPQILNLKDEIRDNLSFLDRCTLDLKDLESREKTVTQELQQTVEALNRERADAAARLSEQLRGELLSLGFSRDIQVAFDLRPTEIVQDVFEHRGRLLWIPNPGQPAQPLDKIASGGELSRFLLALAGLLGADNLPALLFDEVDSGIGGLILGQVGQRISELADKQQVILITHWPQLAAEADCHFHVHKEVLDQETFTRCRRLSPEEIQEELIRMAGGGEQGRIVAGQLLEQKQKG